MELSSIRVKDLLLCRHHHLKNKTLNPNPNPLVIAGVIPTWGLKEVLGIPLTLLL